MSAGQEDEGLGRSGGGMQDAAALERDDFVGGLCPNSLGRPASVAALAAES